MADNKSPTLGSGASYRRACLTGVKSNADDLHG